MQDPWDEVQSLTEEQVEQSTAGGSTMQELPDTEVTQQLANELDELADLDAEIEHQLQTALSSINEAIPDHSTTQTTNEILHQPLSPVLAAAGVTTTVLQECYFTARMKNLQRTTAEYLEIDLKRQADLLNKLPGGSLYPRSLYMDKKLLGISKAERFERHICVRDCLHLPLIPSEDPENEACEKCQGRGIVQ